MHWDIHLLLLVMNARVMLSSKDEVLPPAMKGFDL